MLAQIMRLLPQLETACEYAATLAGVRRCQRLGTPQVTHDGGVVSVCQRPALGISADLREAT